MQKKKKNAKENELRNEPLEAVKEAQEWRTKLSKRFNETKQSLLF